ncbi:hypothetical protein D9M71_423370 [compost metagenome]
MKARPPQRGMALLVSLVLLLLLTIIAITAATQSSIQERMAANSQQQHVAFQAAESGIQSWLQSYTNNPRIEAISTGKTRLSDSAPVFYTASAPIPGKCESIVGPYSLNGADGGTTFQFACFNIESTGQSCVDANCSDSDNPARSKHVQGHLVRY